MFLKLRMLPQCMGVLEEEGGGKQGCYIEEEGGATGFLV